MGFFDKIDIGGAGIGSLLGGVVSGPAGTAIGGLLGSGAVGSPGDLLDKIKGTTGLKKTPYEYDPRYENEQNVLKQVLADRAYGKSPSYAELQTRQNLANVLAQQQAGIKSIGGVGGALKQRLLANAAANVGAKAAIEGSQAELKERQDAQGMLANQLAQLQAQQTQQQQIKSGIDAANQQRRLDMTTGVLTAGAKAAGGGTPAVSAPAAKGKYVDEDMDDFLGDDEE